MAALILLVEGCGLTDVKSPALTGPSTTFLDITLRANPDILTADNRSKSVITATVTSPQGPVAGQTLYFQETELGSVVNLGTLSSNTAVTNGNGQATVTFQAPARTDVDAQIFIQIEVRPQQGDASGPFNYHSVTIELRPAEPSQFPQVPGAQALNCDFAIEPANGNGSFQPGNQVLFQDTSSDPNTSGRIIRYQWDFGDGTVGQGPDVNHAYAFPGNYSVTDIPTDNLGVTTPCTKNIAVSDTPLATSAGRR
jgi:hypothetical protein